VGNTFRIVGKGSTRGRRVVRGARLGCQGSVTEKKDGERRLSEKLEELGGFLLSGKVREWVETKCLRNN